MIYNFQRLYWWALIVPIIICLFFGFQGGETTRFLWDELGPIEILSAFGYLIGSFFFFSKSVEMTGLIKGWFIFWGVLCIIFFGEETSWLQHYIGYATPEAVVSNNAQNEFNVHNLDFFQGRQLGDTNFKLGNIFSSQMLFQIGFLGYFLILPIATLLKRGRQLILLFQIPSPNFNYGLFSAIAVLITVIATLIVQNDTLTKSAIAESREMIFAMIIAIFSYLCAKKSK